MSDFDLWAIRFLQDLTPGWARPAVDFVSVLGGPVGWYLVMVLAFWWSGSRLGVRVALVTTVAGVGNVFLKWWLVGPRPFFVSDSVKALAVSDGLGMPSGHAQGATSQWGALWRWGSQGWLAPAAVLMIAGAGLCRIYYGLHSPTQVVVGWTVGLLVLVAAIRLEPLLVRWGRGLGMVRAVVYVTLMSIVLLGGGLALEREVSGTPFPQEWERRYYAAAEQVGEEEPEFRPFDHSDLAAAIGGLLGSTTVALYYGRSEPFYVRTRRRRGLVTGLGVVVAPPGVWLLAEVASVLGEFSNVLLFPSVMWLLVVVVPRLVQRFERGRTSTPVLS